MNLASVASEILSDVFDFRQANLEILVHQDFVSHIFHQYCSSCVIYYYNYVQVNCGKFLHHSSHRRLRFLSLRGSSVELRLNAVNEC